jgi:hypothetical protein
MKTKTINDLDTFTHEYFKCALWASHEDGTPLDDNYDPMDFHPDAVAAMVADCQKFQEENATDIAHNLSLAGYHFWLTRNGHGVGFWDGDWPEGGDRLTKASDAFGETWLYVGDDAKLHIL